MERVLTQEDRIRRAEEIYLRRRNSRPQYRETREVTNSKKEPTRRSLKLFKKMALQIVICLLLYCIFYLIYDTNYSFSDTTISTTKEILNYDINFNEIYKYISENVMSFINKDQNTTEENSEQENVVENNNEESTNNADNNEEQQNEISVNALTPETPNQQEETPEPVEQTSAEEPDLKQLYSLILPVKRRSCIIRIWSKRI